MGRAKRQHWSRTMNSVSSPMRFGFALVFLPLLVSPNQAFGAEPEFDLVIQNARIVDVVGERVSEPVAIAVRGGRISRIGRKDSSAARYKINAQGRFLLPGLWDMHVHALWTPGIWPHASAQFLSNCVVGVRDMGGTLDELARARKFRGPAPRLVAAGPILDGPDPVDPSVSWAISDAGDAIRAAARLRGKTDFVKVYTLLPAEAFRPLMAAARRMKLDVAGHVPHEVGALAASAAGMRSIEHMQAETGLYCDPDRPATCDALFATFNLNGTWQTPTLIARSVRAHHFAASHPSAMQSVREFPIEVRQFWEAAVKNSEGAPADEVSRKRKDFEREKKLAALLISRRVSLLAGSDAGLPLVPYGISIHRELELLVTAGLTQSQALRTAIVEPRKYLRRSGPVGIQTGADADFCLLDRNPLERIDHASASRLTVVSGRVAFSNLDPLPELNR